jgi:hypothetical protein
VKEVLLSQVLFLAVAFGLFFSLGHYVLAFQEGQGLFLFSVNYLGGFLKEPGDLLLYAGSFLTQFYASKVLGTLILALVLTLPATLLFTLARRLFPAAPVPWLVLLLPSCLLLSLQANLYHGMENNLGFLLVLLAYLLSVSFRQVGYRIVVLGLLPVFYFLAGGYVWVLLGLLVVHTLVFERGMIRWAYVVLLPTLTAGVVFLFWKVLFLQSVRRALFSPLPSLENPAYFGVLLSLSLYIILFPLLRHLPTPILHERLSRRMFTLPAKVLVLAAVGWLGFQQYDPEIRRVVELEELVWAGDWDEAIKLQERYGSRYRLGQYLYNVALSETDQLCDRLFSGRQDYGPESLFLPWAVENLGDGGLFYYAIGLTNEAHRWAFEDMVTYGYRPGSLKMLARTSLLNGNLRMARKYARFLKKTLFYRDWASDLNELIDDPDLIRSHPDLAEKMDILPKSNFFVEYENPELNLGLLLEGQPDNDKALEYFLAGGLLAKNVEFVVEGIGPLAEAGYSNIPRHLQEAVLLQSSLTDMAPDLGGMAISPEIQARFDRFTSAFASARRNPTIMREQMREDFGDTYWFYYFFS